MALFDRRELKLLSLPPSLEPRCGHCKLDKTCNSPKMKWSGKGRKKILVLAEAPGEEEDKKGVQLVGNSGKELERVFRRAGIDMREDCWLENSLMCRPPGNKIDKDYYVDDCRPHVIKTVTELKPEVIILLGGTACQSLLGWLWKEKVGAMARWAGYQIPHRGLNAWICPTYHPSFLLREKSQVLDRQFAAHLDAAAKLTRKSRYEGQGFRPYYKTQQPDTDFVEVVLDDTKMAEIIGYVQEEAEVIGNPIAFDYETTTKKPHGPFAEIYACSIAATEEASGTDFAWAFPWRGKVIPAMKRLLASPRVKKVGSNIKFEHEWTAWHLGVQVKGWDRDTMLAAHALENGSKSRLITSIKFQAFVHLGIDEWDSHIAEFLKTKDGGGNSPNRIKYAPLRDLLVYCGLDSLYELQVGRKQTKTIEEGQ